MRRLTFMLGLLALASLTATVGADERLEGVACRSVHLAYTAGEGTSFYTEVTVEKSAPSTRVSISRFRQRRSMSVAMPM